MRLLSLAVIAGLFAVGFTYADDKKPADAAKKDDKKEAAKFTGTVTKVDGMKITVKSEGKDGKDSKEETFTTNDKTKFAAAPSKKEEKKDKLIADDKKADAKEMSIKDVKEGTKVSVEAGEDKVATAVWIYPAKPAK